MVKYFQNNYPNSCITIKIVIHLIQHQQFP
ncbi:CCR4-associated factor 4 [Flavobacteriaceae bacterium AU392]|nr:CCR4-associated factor 4 [Flavobacteriaceae bacterium]RKM81660.1 CCR4-associated factor 4 [Flavobacteriaceae bacterium AU392]